MTLSLSLSLPITIYLLGEDYRGFFHSGKKSPRPMGLLHHKAGLLLRARCISTDIPPQTHPLPRTPVPLSGGGTGAHSQRCKRAHATTLVWKGVYSLYFLIPNKDRTLRPLLDLRLLNKYTLAVYFHRVTLQFIIPLLQGGGFMTAFDLKSTYFHIQIHPAHRC